MEQFDRFVAEYQPQRRDDLKPEASRWIGWSGFWEATWVIEEGPYVGQFACAVDPVQEGAPPASALVWVPECDLSIYTPESAMAAPPTRS
jgi:hypothetical protein